MRNQPFFIVGLPRSRTAWLANLLTTADCFCFHELEKDFENMGQTLLFFGGFMQHVRFIGNSSSGLPFSGKWFLEKFPDARWVFIERDMLEVDASLKRLFKIEKSFLPALQRCVGRIETLKKQIAPDKQTAFLFSQLEDTHCLINLHNFCLPGVPVDRWRLEMLQKLRVEIIVEKWHSKCNFPK